MSYNNYGQSGYGQSNPYASQSNPYSQQANPYASSQSPGGSYGRPQQNQYQQNPFEPNNSAPSYNNDVEMAAVTGNGAGYGGGQNILNETRRINDGSDEIERLLSRLENAHRRALNDTATDRNSPTVREIDSLNADIMAEYKNLLNRMKRIKQTPGAGSDTNTKHIGVADRKLQGTRQKFMKLESEYQRRMKEQTERQYRTAFPQASEEEVRTACEEPNQQVFAQALMNRDRRGESRQVLGQVRDRHDAIQKIERQMIELAELFNDMERMVVEQEPQIERTEQAAIETNTHVTEGNVQLERAEKSARAARRKKWICFWIVVLIIIIAAAVIAIAVAVTKNK